jgi:hypothetical protein
MRRFHISDPCAGFYAVTAYATDRRQALNEYREQWYPRRSRLPKGVAIWE